MVQKDEILLGNFYLEKSWLVFARSLDDGITIKFDNIDDFLKNADDKYVDSLFSSDKYRDNFKAFDLRADEFVNAQSHHMFPQKFEDVFINAGINIHNPRNMAWWEAGKGIAGNHSSASGEYNALWETFLAGNRTKEEIYNFGRLISEDYGLRIHL